MKNKRWRLPLVFIYSIILCFFLFAAIGGSRAVTVIAENIPIKDRICIIIDAGHGGEDGGATSCTGVLESKINLEIALRLEDLLHLLGYDTRMIRTTDKSVYTSGETIAAKKVSDLRERVRIINGTKNALLVSIHQNHFSDSRYSGAQVFYGTQSDGKQLATLMQSTFKNALDPQNNRQVKSAEGVYLMKSIQCPGVLVECGFLSNPKEEAKLRSSSYQKVICCAISVAIAQFVNT